MAKQKFGAAALSIARDACRLDAYWSLPATGINVKPMIIRTSIVRPYLRLTRPLLPALVALAVSGVAVAQQPATQATPTTQQQPHPTPALPLSGFAELAGQQVQAVVNISSTQMRANTTAPGQSDRGGPPQGLPELPPGSPFEEFFRDFFGNRRQENRPGVALGSGFIIDASGLIVTNRHVIENAEKITVILHDDTTLPAELVGADTLTDLALLRVRPEKPLQATRWGDSDRTRIGDWVVAIGNPFGLGGSVTQGILSARARDIQQGPYDEFLQTDAAINRGNSGGPLFNLAGEVIGINTAIFSPSGGSVGIGFAVPSSLAKPIIEQLRQNGRVRRGWLGVQVQQVTPEIAEALGLGAPRGALVSSVSPNGPAARAGLMVGDVIVSFDQKPIPQMRRLPVLVAGTPIGNHIDVSFFRQGRERTLEITVGELDPELITNRKSQDRRPVPEPQAKPQAPVAGLVLAPINPQLRETFKIPAEIQEGAVVTEVADGSTAEARGMAAGDVILQLGDAPIRNAQDLRDRLEEAKRAGRSSVVVLVNRAGAARFVALPTG